MSTLLKKNSRWKLKTAFKWLRTFEQLFPQRQPLFKIPKFRGDLKAELYNEWSMILFVTWLASVRSQKTTKRLNIETISQYHSMLKVALSVRYGFELEGSPQRLPRILKRLRRERPHGVRKKRRGLRRRHLKNAWKKAKATFHPKTAPNASEARDRANKWAAVTTAWQALARGCELTAPSRKRWKASKLPSRADLTFDKLKNGTRIATVMLRPYKKKGKAPKIPIIFCEDDHGGADTYWALRELERRDPISQHSRKKTPLFRTSCGPLTQREFIQALKEIARTLGIDPKLIGGHSARIGGSTDLVDTKGSALLLQAKGRWGGDIGRIYARMTRRAQVSASKLMQTGRCGRDLEDIFPDFTQPS